MVRRHGLQVGLKSRSYSKSSHTCDDLLTHNPSRLAIRHQLRTHGSTFTAEEVQIIDSKHIRLQKLIETFENQADSFLLHQGHMDDTSISSLGHYDEYDHVDDAETSIGKGTKHSGPTYHYTTITT
jgi:hypothetical protein